MSMSTVARGARKLKSLVDDQVKIPSPQELLARKADEIAATKAELARVVSKIIEAEKQQPSQRGNYAGMLASRLDLKQKLERLQNEAEMIKQQIERPAPPLSDRQQAWADAYAAAADFDPYRHIERGTSEQIAAAQRELDELIDEYRRAQPTGNARDAWAVRKAAARTKLEALKGPPYPAHRPWASDETLKAARKAQGFKS
jgi:exonuclease VII large subunit